MCQIRCTELTLIPTCLAIIWAVQWVTSARWIGLRQRNRELVHRRRQPRDPRRTGLVAQQPVDPLRHEALLPALHGDLAFARLPHDRGRADAVCRHQHDARSPHMFLPAIPIRHDRRQAHTIALTHLDCNPLAHAQPPSPSRAYTMRTLLSDFIH